MKKNAFTLIEMLVVIVLIGVVLAIAIPSVANILHNRSNKMFTTHEKLIKDKTNAFIVKNRGIFNSNSCTKLNYEFLEMEEEDITCTGTIVVVNEGNNSYTKKYYLNCTDTRTNVVKNIMDGNINVDYPSCAVFTN